MQQEPNHKHFTRGGQISFHNLRMWEQIVKSLLIMCALVWACGLTLIAWYRINSDYLIQTGYYYTAKVLSVAGLNNVFNIPYKGHIYRQTVQSLVSNPYYAKVSIMVLEALKDCLWMTSLMTSIFAFFSILYFIQKGRSQTAHQFIRGSQIQKPNVVSKKIRKDKMASDLTIDTFPLI